MISIVAPLTNEKKYGDVSAGDCTTFGVGVVQNTMDLATANTQIAASAAKPIIADVKS